MARFGRAFAEFFASGDLDTPLEDLSEQQLILYPVSVDSVDAENGEGDVTAKFAMDSGALGVLSIQERAMCCIYQSDALRPDALTLPFCPPFIIEEIDTSESGYFTVRGPTLIAELKRWLIYRPLGALVTSTTTTSTAVDGPRTNRTVATAAPSGNDAIELDSDDGAHVGDEIRIYMDGISDPHVTTVTAVEPSGMDNVIQFKDKLPYTAGVGNAVHFRTRRFSVDTNADKFKVGCEVDVALNPTGTFTTLVAEPPGGANGRTITLRDGMTDDAVQGATVTVRDRSGKSTSDVTNVFGVHTTGWTVDFESGTGTAAGTRYGGGGDSIYDILRSIAAETGEFFRLKPAIDGVLYRTIQWRRTHDTAGYSGTLRLVQTGDTDGSNVNRAQMVDRPTPRWSFDLVTQIVPVAGDPRVTLFHCTSAAITAADTEGFSTVLTGLGLYAPPYVQNDGAYTAAGVHQRRIVFSEVQVEGDNVASIQEAADRLLRLAVDYLKRHAGRNTDVIEIETGRVVSAVVIQPGQKLQMEYTAPDGSWTWGSSDWLYVKELRRQLSADDGIPFYSMRLSNTPEGTTTDGAAVGQILRNAERTAAAQGAPDTVSLSVSQTIVQPGGGSAVTAADTSISVGNDQAIAVRLKATGSRLAVSNGLMVVSTANALTTPAQVMRADSTGRITLHSAGIGSPAHAEAALLVVPPAGAIFPAVRLKRSAGHTGAAMRVENTTGSLVFRVRGTREIEDVDSVPQYPMEVVAPMLTRRDLVAAAGVTLPEETGETIHRTRFQMINGTLCLISTQVAGEE